jgi:hypothetical protein
VDNAGTQDGGDQETVPENQYISGMEEDEGSGDDGMSEFIADLGKGQVLGEKMYELVKEHLNRKVSPTYSYAQFTFAVNLLHIKSFSRMSNVAFNATMNLLQKGFPEACLPYSFDAAMKYIRSMGLGYEKIHVCNNNCILSRKEKYAKLDVCPVCCEADSIWKDADTNKHVPQKVLRHFLLISRLKRMFLSSQTTKDARWHKSKQKLVNNELSHPADGEAWKEFNKR